MEHIKFSESFCQKKFHDKLHTGTKSQGESKKPKTGKTQIQHFYLQVFKLSINNLVT